MNKGAVALSKKLAKRGEQMKLSKDLGLDQGYVSKLMRGLRVPGIRVRRLLEKHLKIRMQCWDQN